MSDTEEIFVSDEPEIVEVKKKGTKKPLSEERKQALREQLKKAREAKKAKKEAGIVDPPKDPKASKVKKMLEAEGEEPAVYVKAVKRMGKDHTEDIKALKEEIATLKSNKTSKEDIEEIKALKMELKELRDLAKQYKQNQTKKKVEKKVVQPVQKKVEVVAEALIPPTPVKPRYATYQKSIWSQFS